MKTMPEHLGFTKPGGMLVLYVADSEGEEGALLVAAAGCDYAFHGLWFEHKHTEQRQVSDDELGGYQT